MDLGNKLRGLFLDSKDEFQSFKKCYLKNKKIDSLALQVENKDHELISNFNHVSSKVLKQSESFIILEKLEKKNSILSHLLQAYIFMKNANKAQAEAKIKEVLSHPFDYYLLLAAKKRISTKELIRIYKYLLNAFLQDLNNSKLVQTLMFYLHHHTLGPFHDFLDDEFDYPESLSEIREFYGSYNFGLAFPMVWAPAINQLSSSQEYLNYIQKVKLPSKIKKDSSHLYLLKDVTKISLEKDMVLDHFKKLNKKCDLYSEYLVISMLDTENFYKYLDANSSLKIGIVTNRKRKFFKSLLDAHILEAFTVFKLLELGDESIDYFQYLVK
ncbi:MAG: hypothetical protein CME62_11110 [Halobacteriovoraceae bacterium]|nr:hypothetical protein [Halobacteriovoraceae bacterium]|tara:strand:- start:12746 stop:13726 length:981 start_codon:yes stop_codon:yes gene_type:complete